MAASTRDVTDTEDAASTAPEVTPGAAVLVSLWQKVSSSGILVTAPILGLIIFSVRCLAVSDYQPKTAQFVFLNTPFSDALRAIALGILPWVMLLILTTIGFYAGQELRLKRHWQLWLCLLGSLTSLALHLLFMDVFYLTRMSDLWIVGGALVYWSYAFFIGRYTVSGGGKILVLIGIVIVTLYLVVPGRGSLLDHRMWMLPEKITLVDGRYYTAYNLSENQGYVALLTTKREAVLLNQELVQGRTVCLYEYECAELTDPTAPKPAPAPAPSAESIPTASPSGR